MKKRLPALLLCLALCLPCAWVVANVIRIMRYTYGDFVYIVLDDGTAEIRQYYGKDPVLEIPSEMRGHPVSRIGNRSFEWRFSLTDVTIPDSVREIGEGAFYGCYNLKRVQFPDSVAVIEDKAFAQCRSMEAFEIPESVHAIGSGILEQCLCLKKVSIPAGTRFSGYNPFADCPRLDSIAVSEADSSLIFQDGILYRQEEDGWHLICRLKTASSDTCALPEEVTRIEAHAFYNCSQLSEIRLPDPASSNKSKMYRLFRSAVFLARLPDRYDSDLS